MKAEENIGLMWWTIHKYLNRMYWDDEEIIGECIIALCKAAPMTEDYNYIIKAIRYAIYGVFDKRRYQKRICHFSTFSRDSSTEYSDTFGWDDIIGGEDLNFERFELSEALQRYYENAPLDQQKIMDSLLRFADKGKAAEFLQMSRRTFNRRLFDLQVGLSKELGYVPQCNRNSTRLKIKEAIR